MSGHSGNVNDVAFSPKATSHNFAVSASDDGTARIWGLQSTQGKNISCVKVIQAGKGKIRKVGWLGDWMWTSEGGNERISVWENPCDTEDTKLSQIFTVKGVGADPWLELITDDDGEFMAIGDTGKEWMGVAHFDGKKGMFNWVR